MKLICVSFDIRDKKISLEEKKQILFEFIRKQILSESIPAVVVGASKRMGVFQILVINEILNPLNWEYGKCTIDPVIEGMEERALFYLFKHAMLFVCNDAIVDV